MNKSQIIKIYLLHFAGAVLSVILFLWFISLYLNTYTKHGEYIETPNVLKLSLKDAIKIIESKKLRYTIIDSIFNPDEKPGIVISQNPEPSFKVKENRTVYLVITSFLPPKIQMPKLVDMSERQAIMTINSYNLKLGKIIYEPSYCNGCVIMQLHKNKEIKPGEKINKGSVIDIVVGIKGNASITSPEDTIKTEENSLNEFE